VIKMIRPKLLIRLGSAAILGPAVLWMMWAGKPSFSALITVSAMLCVWEWCKLTEWRQHGPVARVMGVTLLMTLVIGIIGLWPLAWLALAASAVITALWAWVKKAYPLRAFTGAVYVGGPHLMALWLHQYRDGPMLVLCTVLIIWACDGGAYFVGKALRGPKLAPEISPNKTWSGAIGGMIAALVAGWGCAVVFHRPQDVLIFGTVVISIAAQLGDLFESALKRQFKAKDSGELIPGHGGLLDRIDGLMAALVVVGVILMLVPKIWGVS